MVDGICGASLSLISDGVHQKERSASARREKRSASSTRTPYDPPGSGRQLAAQYGFLPMIQSEQPLKLLTHLTQNVPKVAVIQAGFLPKPSGRCATSVIDKNWFKNVLVQVHLNCYVSLCSRQGSRCRGRRR